MPASRFWRARSLAGATPQLRNAATTGGNLNQRTRCYYFNDTATPCNKREPGSGCSAIGGLNRIHAILGTSEHCIATHPSDMCVGLAALGAEVHVAGRDGERRIAFVDYHRLPGTRPQHDNTLQPGEIVVAVVPAASNSGLCRPLQLSEAAGPAVLCFCPRLGRSRPGTGWRHHRLGAHRAWRRRTQALATRRRRSGPDRQGCR